MPYQTLKFPSNQKKVKHFAERFGIQHCMLNTTADFQPYHDIFGESMKKVSHACLISEDKNVVLYDWSPTDVSIPRFWVFIIINDNRVFDLGPVEFNKGVLLYRELCLLSKTLER